MKTIYAIVFLALLAAACARESPPEVIGGDRDEFGCLTAAGYSWCDAKQKCIRQWEENCTAEQNSPGAAPPDVIGGEREEYGCLIAAGYSWCEEKQKCVRVWEENCTTGQDPAQPSSDERLAYTECREPRPEACTADYSPVCAQVDNGIRCIKAPCPSTDERTYSNGCTACADPKVYGYWPGACGDPPSDTPATLCGPGEDGYMSQIGPACVTHYGKEEILQWKQCTSARECGSGGACVFATRATSGEELDWSGPMRDGRYTESLRCAPQEYRDYLLHTSGAEGVDEDGEFYAMIA